METKDKAELIEGLSFDSMKLMPFGYKAELIEGLSFDSMKLMPFGYRDKLTGESYV